MIWYGFFFPNNLLTFQQGQWSVVWQNTQVVKHWGALHNTVFLIFFFLSFFFKTTHEMSVILILHIFSVFYFSAAAQNIAAIAGWKTLHYHQPVWNLKMSQFGMWRLLCCIKLDMLRLHWSGAFHMNTLLWI